MPGRPLGRRLRVGRYSTTFSTAGAATGAGAEVAAGALVLAESGWPTLQLSR